jgi:hypothetical protein
MSRAREMKPMSEYAEGSGVKEVDEEMERSWYDQDEGSIAVDESQTSQMFVGNSEKFAKQVIITSAAFAIPFAVIHPNTLLFLLCRCAGSRARQEAGAPSDCQSATNARWYILYSFCPLFFNRGADSCIIAVQRTTDGRRID